MALRAVGLLIEGKRVTSGMVMTGCSGSISKSWIAVTVAPRASILAHVRMVSKSLLDRTLSKEGFTNTGGAGRRFYQRLIPSLSDERSHAPGFLRRDTWCK